MNLMWIPRLGERMQKNAVKAREIIQSRSLSEGNTGPHGLLFLKLTFLGLRWVFAFSNCGTRAQGHSGSVIVARRLCCPAACGIKIPDQGLNLRSLHWKAGS